MRGARQASTPAGPSAGDLDREALAAQPGGDRLPRSALRPRSRGSSAVEGGRGRETPSGPMLRKACGGVPPDLWRFRAEPAAAGRAVRRAAQVRSVASKRTTAAGSAREADPVADGRRRRRPGRRPRGSSSVECSRTRSRKWSRRKVRPTTTPVERPVGVGAEAVGPDRDQRAESERRTGDVPAEEAGHELGRGRRQTSTAVPTCSMRPARMIATRSAIANASSWSWVTKIAVTPRPDEQVAQLGDQPVAQARGRASRAARRASGGPGAGASARASATRCCSPPDSSRTGPVLEARRGRPARASPWPGRSPRHGRRRWARSPNARCRARRGAGTARGPGT